MSNSHTADKFVLRMPNGMRNRFELLKQADSVSMNSLMIEACKGYLERYEELDILIEATRLLKKDLAARLSKAIQQSEAASNNESIATSSLSLQSLN